MGFLDTLNSYEPKLNALAEAIAPLAEQNIAREDEKMMRGVFGINPEFGQRLYGAMDDQRRTNMVEQERRYERQKEQRKMEALQKLAEKIQSGQIDQQQGLIEYAGITGDYSGLFGVGARAPSAVQEYKYFESLSPEEKAAYLRVKRANQTFDRGGSQVFVDPQGNVITEFEKTLPPEQLPETKFEQTRQTELGKASAEKTAGLGQLEQQAGYMVNTIDQLLNPEGGLAPGVEQIVGGIGGLQGRQSAAFPITENQRKFQPFIDQLKGQTFLDAYERLKGGGVITEIEGQKAEQAIARLNQAQSEKDFEAALRELRDVIAKGMERARNNEQVLANPSGSAAPSSQAPAAGGRKTVKFGDLK